MRLPGVATEPERPLLAEIAEAFASPGDRAAAAQMLARLVAAEHTWILVYDERVESLVPAPGLPQTLPASAAWYSVLEACDAAGLSVRTIPGTQGPVQAAVKVLSDRTAFVFIGSATEAEAIDALSPTLVLVSALLRAEQRASAAAGEARAASEDARHGRELTVALDRARTDIETLMFRQQALNRISGLFSESQLDLDRLVQTLTDEATALVEAQVGVFYYTTRDERGESLLLYTLSGAPREAFQKLGTPQATEIFGPTFAGEGVVRLDDVRDDPRFGRNAPHHEMWKRHLPVVSCLAVPVTSRRGALLGGLFFGHPERARFTENHERLLASVVAHAAAALENAQLYREARRAEAAQAEARKEAEAQRRTAELVALRLSQLQVLTAALAQAQSHAEVAGLIVTSAAEALEASASAAFFIDRSDGTYRLAAESGLGPAVREKWLVLPLDAPVPLATALRERVPLHIEPAAHLFADRSNDEGDGAQGALGTVVALPLWSQSTLTGGIAFSFGRSREFGAEDRQFLLALAIQCAQAIQRVRLMEQQRSALKERERLIADLQDTLHHNELFTGVLAHDLRNPLTATLTSAQLLMSRADNDAIAKPAARIFKAGSRMLRMIEQLLDFTRMRLGAGVVVRPQEVNLRELVQEVLEELEGAHADWAFRVGVCGNPMGVWDPNALLQVLSNLTSNAVHHGDPEGGVSVQVDGTRPDEVRFQVRNRGAVPAELLPRLFEPFRGTQHRRPGSKGLGLGLFITKMIVTAHGGTVTVESSADAATVFEVVLPRRAVPPLASAR